MCKCVFKKPKCKTRSFTQHPAPQCTAMHDTHTCITCVCRPVELMQTEMHHVRTLKIMLRVYVRELKENLQMDAGRLDCLFPRLENLLDLHTNFLSRLKERRRESLVPPSDRNYTINKLADVLIAQVWRRHAR